MSGHTNDILRELKSHLDDDTRIEEIIGVLSSTRPRIEIDRDYQKKLKRTLLEQKIVKRSFSWHAYFPLFWVGFACLAVALGIREYLLPILRDTPTPLFSSLTWSSETALSDKATLPSEEVSPLALSIAKEHKEIQSEVDSIVSDLENMDFSREMPTPQASTHAREERVAPTETLDMSTPQWGSLWVSGTVWGSYGGMAMMTAKAWAREALITPSYPSIMKVYAKDAIWTESEIASRSGSWLTIRELPTEKSSIISRKIENLTLGKTITTTEITYLERAKLWQWNTHDLIPVIRYTTDAGEAIIIPLVRGYR